MSETVACVSVRQPWASLIVHGIKDIENRSWHCAHRGPLVIHASKTWTRHEQADHDELLDLALRRGDTRRAEIVGMSRNLTGGLVGACVMTGCVSESSWFGRGRPGYDGVGNWFCGPFGWILDKARAFDFIVPYRGRQGLFRLPIHMVPIGRGMYE